MPRIDDPGGQGEHTGERSDVQGHVPLGGIDDARAPPEDRVAGEHGPRALLHEDHMVLRMPGGVDDLDADGARRYDVAIPEPIFALLGTERQDGRASHVREPWRTRGVVRMMVREQDGLDV